jgi:hypothetical protein
MIMTTPIIHIAMVRSINRELELPTDQQMMIAISHSTALLTLRVEVATDHLSHSVGTEVDTHTEVMVAITDMAVAHQS